MSEANAIPSANPPCECCKWWNRWTQQANPPHVFGECRRHAPVSMPSLKPGHHGLVSKWPSTRAVDWCGSWRPIAVCEPMDRGQS